MNKIEKKVMIVFSCIAMILFFTGITYSLFTSSGKLNVNQEIAKFVFNARQTDTIELPLSDIKPGDVNTYNFQIANKKEQLISDVKINYQIIIKTFHLMPLEIKLYKTNNQEELILNCDETFSRNKENQLICNSPVLDMPYSTEKLDDYKLEIKFPEKYNDESYKDLVDFIDVEIKSWQATEK